MSYPVSDLKSAYRACNPNVPLPVEDERYIDLSRVRGEGQNVVKKIAKAINYKIPDEDAVIDHYYRQLVTGHRGCGKSTELLRLQARLEQDRLFVVYFDVEAMLNLGDVDYIDILLLIVYQVVEKLDAAKISLDPKLLDDIYQWFADTALSKNLDKELSTKVETEVELGTSIPLLGKMLARLSAGVRTNELERKEIRLTLRKEWYIFVARLNLLLEQARLKVKQHKHRDLVVIIDGLEKMFYEPIRDNAGNPTGESTHSMLFIKHAEQLTIPKCHLIYTIPISLLYQSNVTNTFGADGVSTIPMVNIKQAEGIHCLKALLEKRVVVDALFEQSSLVEKLIKMSGGAVRDLMRLMQMACLATETDLIDEESVDQAIRELVREYGRLIQEKDIEALQSIVDGQWATGDEKYSRLLHNRVIHEYQNGKPWADLHPAIREVEWVMKQIKFPSA
jgi:hypothetical protein